MLYVEVKKGNIEKALKDLKGKVIRTKQNAKSRDSKGSLYSKIKIPRKLKTLVKLLQLIVVQLVE
jgi:ribosomal protein S21